MTRLTAPTEYCSFCGSLPGEVAWLARGPDVAICDQCVANIMDELGGAPERLEAPTIDAVVSDHPKTGGAP